MINLAKAEIARVRAAGRERTLPERTYRQISRLIDLACEQVEQLNLAGGGPCPSRVRDLVTQLSLMAGAEPIAPDSSYQAHEELLRLSEVLLSRPGGDLECDREAER